MSVLENFKNILKDRVFMIALRNGFLIIALSLFAQLPLSMGLAVLVGRDLPGRVIFRTIFFLPYVLSEVIAALMWLFILNPDPDRGFVNAVIVFLGGVTGLAREHRLGSIVNLCRVDMEIFWLSHVVVHDRFAKYSY